jgi:hypothetical protein
MTAAAAAALAEAMHAFAAYLRAKPRSLILTEGPGARA